MTSFRNSSELLSEVLDARHKQVDGNCDVHGAFTAHMMQLRDRWVGGDCPKCMDEKREREDREYHERMARERKENSLRNLLGRSGIPERFKGRTFDNYAAETVEQKRTLSVCRAYAERFPAVEKSGTSLIMCGKPGTGKTHLACAIGNHLMHDHQKSALFISASGAIRMIRETWGKKGESEDEAIKRLVVPDLLILDEVGVQYGSDAEKLLLFEIINGRYEKVKPMILISNLKASELGEFIGERVMDRLIEGGGTVMSFGWESYRKKAVVA